MFNKWRYIFNCLGISTNYNQAHDICLPQLTEEIRHREKRETELYEEIEGQKDSFHAAQRSLSELTEEKNTLSKLLEEKESSIQVCYMRTMEYMNIAAINVICFCSSIYIMFLIGVKFAVLFKGK